jgi:hypothetical protein
MFSESSLKIQGGQSPLLPVTYSPDFPGLKWGLSLGKAGWIFFHFVKVYDFEDAVSRARDPAIGSGTTRGIRLPARAGNRPFQEGLGSLAPLRHAFHVMVGIKWNSISACFEGRHPAVVEDRLATKVVIALLRFFQLSSSQMYPRRRAGDIVVALLWTLGP